MAFLKSHLADIHDSKRSFGNWGDCEICDLVSVRSGVLKSHLDDVHDSTLSFWLLGICEICDHFSMTRGVLKSHLADSHDLKRSYIFATAESVRFVILTH